MSESPDDSSVTSPAGPWLLIAWISDADASEDAATRDVTLLSPPSQRALHSRLALPPPTTHLPDNLTPSQRALHSRLSPFLCPPSLDLQQPNVDHAMENPAAEIEDVILAITASLNPDVQRAAIYRYFAPDASFRHPLCTVPPSSKPATVYPPSQASPVLHAFPSPLPFLRRLPAFVVRLLTPTGLATSSSRETILRVYQWYRVLSPHLRVHVNNVVYDAARNEIYAEVVQRFHIRWNVLMPAAESRLITHITLRELPHAAPAGKPLYVIAAQEDFYHPEDLLAFVAPLLVPLLLALLLLGTWACVLGASLGRAAGYWRVKRGGGEGVHGIELEPRGAPPVDTHEASYADKAKQGLLNGDKGKGEAEAEAESPVAQPVAKDPEEWPTPTEAFE
ncbi:uncharacterized protein C8Q71DRAFT_721308 [Rhodofomes roseus]|uniref:SigF-like NTF2-like domain-containing protein n=1 Tax=Rhodofomes roseus TaxID=34475 RepID=A0ABQ8KR02_9APHY|nr:uncharacterized protein C8Q71DRAFT_721308 [Rhodofomes roseus]KAH9840853.1 hypothetical protein C8Q71DRAFT_721308 [Rhodofomes roseus]